MKFNYIFFIYGMLVALIIIGILQFYNLPLYLDVVLWIIALSFGIYAWIRKFRINNNIIGILSILTVAINIILFFAIPDLILIVKFLTVLSVLGIILAITSKKIWFIVTGIIMNVAILVVVYLLLIAIGISEP